ncbi:MAG: hypothetical protein DSZ05_04810 [Sulfurospirillum sp.]|nr:MAG: hypothetical protein DSZ05_04810 [Sulfurospirillum sp.]
MHKVIFFLFVVVIVYGIFNAIHKKKSTKLSIDSTHSACRRVQKRQDILADELARIDTPEYVKKYIVHVINHGSDTLGFKGGIMEGGYADREDAEKIACYVLELSGKKCPHPYPKDAAMFYTSICGGCHGNDGKGLGGNYPDLTRKKLLGIEKRETFLKAQLAKVAQKSRE